MEDLALRGLPAGVGLKLPSAAWVKSPCRERRGKRHDKHVRYEPRRRTPVNHRSSVENILDDIKTGEVILLRDEPIGNLFTGWAVSGIEMARARFGLLCGTARTCIVMQREPVKRSNLKTLSTNVQCRGGPTHSSVEGSVMDLEPRSRVVLPKSSLTREGRNE